MHILVTRPEPAATATAAAWRAIGHEVTVAPLLVTAALDWERPHMPPPAIAFTSAAAVRLGGAGLYAGLPAFAVGGATAAAAREAGFADVRETAGDATTLFATVAAAGFRAVLHLAGVDRTVVDLPPGLAVVVRDVYAARPVGLPSAVADVLRAGAVDVVALFSARTARHFAAEADAAGLRRGRLQLAVLAPGVAAAAGTGWQAVATAAVPTEAALLAAMTRAALRR
ncbi:MAG: uroporphyrinogen-III synthase [Janthinobacterium lividum]